jgi:hypothetical protein
MGLRQYPEGGDIDRAGQDLLTASRRKMVFREASGYRTAYGCEQRGRSVGQILCKSLDLIVRY